MSCVALSERGLSGDKPLCWAQSWSKNGLLYCRKSFPE